MSKSIHGLPAANPLWTHRELSGTPLVRVGRLFREHESRATAVCTVLFPTEIHNKELSERPIDILALKNAERALFVEGPKISVIGDGNAVIREGVPLRALMASAAKVHDLFQIKPLTRHFRVYGGVNRESIEALLDIFTTEESVERKNINLTTNSFAKNLLMYQACLSLGILYYHTEPLRKALCAEITAGTPTVHELNTIANLIPSTDLLFKHHSNVMYHQGLRKEILDIAVFLEWLSNKRVLLNAMVETDQQHMRRSKTASITQCSPSSNNDIRKWCKTEEAVDEAKVEEEAEKELNQK